MQSTHSAVQGDIHTSLRSFWDDRSGNGALEYVLVLALLALGTTSILGSAAAFFSTVFATLVSSVTAVWPS